MNTRKNDVARLMVFSGNANPELANEIARTLGIPLGDALVSLFSDGEINIEIRENVREGMFSNNIGGGGHIWELSQS